MPNIDVTIGNRNYELVCDAGEENHIRNLARNVTQRFKEIEKAFGQSSDGRLLAITCLVMEDELRQTKEGKSPTVAEAMQINESAVENARQKVLESVVEQIESLAKKVETL